MASPTLELSIIVCTRNRPESLRETLDGLLASYRPEHAIEVVVVENGSLEETVRVVDSFRGRIPIRFIRETKEGKGHALNRVLAEGGLGQIIAGLDDDMTLGPEWISRVLAACARRPEVDIFGGHVYAIWPVEPVPEWARHCRRDILGWAFSALGPKEVAARENWIRRDRWPCGNHFWFRSKLLTPASRFGNLWVPEPGLFLDFMNDGVKAVICNDVLAGHRVQPHLLDETAVVKRAAMIGRTFAAISLCPFRPNLKVPQSFHRRPVVTRLYCLAMIIRYGGLYLVAQVCGGKGRWFERKLHGLERTHFFRELLRLAGQDPAYRIFGGGA